MAKLKLGAIDDNKPVKLTIELPAVFHRDLVAYGQVLARETGQRPPEPAKLIAPIIARFMATDRAVSKWRRTAPVPDDASETGLVARVDVETADGRVLQLSFRQNSSICTHYGRGAG